MDKWLSMGINGTLLILAVICFRYFFSRQIPRRFFVFLWICAIARLLLPVSIPVWQPSGRSPALHELSEKLQTSAVVLYNNAAPILLPDTGSQAVAPSAGVSDIAAIQGTVFLCSLWLPIAVLLAAHILNRHMHDLRLYRMSLPADERIVSDWLRRHRTIRQTDIRKSEFVKSPLTYGLIHPVILLPSEIELNPEELLCILEHEWTHIRRWDILVKYLLYLTICIYWFHPLVWMMAPLLNRDIELACDEEAIRHVSDHFKKTYLLTLIRLAENYQPSAFPMNAGFSRHSEIEERIRFIMKTKKYSYKTAALTIGMLLCTVTTFTVSAQDASKEAAAGVTTESAIKVTTETAVTSAAETAPKKQSEAADNSVDLFHTPSDTSTPKTPAPTTTGAEQTSGGSCDQNDPTVSGEQIVINDPTAAGEQIMINDPTATGEQIVTLARQYLGNPYQYNGDDLFRGVDDDGFVKAIYALAGIDLPDDLYTLAASDYEIPLAELRAGDIIFYTETKDQDVWFHAAIYNGDGRIIHAKNRKKGIALSDLSYRPFGSAVRILE